MFINLMKLELIINLDFSLVRQCIGMRLALFELKYLITRVLLEYDLFKPENFELKELSGRRFNRPIRLTVGLRKRAQ